MKSRPSFTLLASSGLLSAALAAAMFPACERYEPPPTPAIAGLEGGLLFDSKAPLFIDFGQPIDLATLNLKVAFLDTDLEGNLPDEDENPDTELRVLLAHDPIDGDRGGSAVLEGDGSRLRFDLQSALPVGPKLVLLVEPGIKGTGGRTRINRTKIPFSYAVRCTAGTRATNLQSGVYFVLLDVDQPLGTQIQLYGAIEVDESSGAFAGTFTNADRNPDQSRCLPERQCSGPDACRRLPSVDCVVPSLKAGKPDEYPDWVPNETPPVGYSFQVEGCAVDDATGAGVVTAPARMVVQQPPVTIEGLSMTAFFGPGAGGAIGATGSLVADSVFLGTNRIGAGKGSMTAVRIPDAEVPPNVPRPKRPTPDAGAGGAGDAGR